MTLGEGGSGEAPPSSSGVPLGSSSSIPPYLITVLVPGSWISSPSSHCLSILRRSLLPEINLGDDNQVFLGVATLSASSHFYQSSNDKPDQNKTKQKARTIIMPILNTLNAPAGTAAPLLAPLVTLNLWTFVMVRQSN